MLMKNLKKCFIGFSIFSVATIATLGATFGLSASSKFKNNSGTNPDNSSNNNNVPNQPEVKPGEPNIPSTKPEEKPVEPEKPAEPEKPVEPEIPAKPEEKPLILVPKSNLTSSTLKLQNLTIDEAITKMTKEWIVENKNILFSSGQENLTLDKLENLSFTPIFESNNQNIANIKLTINNNVILNISHFSIIPSSTFLYDLQSWPLGVGQAINISSYVKDKNKIMEAISLYIVNQQNTYVNNQKDFYMQNYILERKNLFQSIINNDKLIWNFDLKGKTNEFKNALGLSLFRKNWDNLFSNMPNASQYITNFKVTFNVQQINNKIDRYKLFATNVELVFEQQNSSNSTSIKTINLAYDSNQQSLSSYELTLSKNSSSNIGSVIPSNSSPLLNLEPSSSTIYVDSFKGLGNIIYSSVDNIMRNITRDILYDNKDKIFADSYLFEKIDFIERVTPGGLVGNNYDKFSINVKWKDITDLTTITFAISQDNRIKILNLHNLQKIPVSNKKIGVYTNSADIIELRKRIPFLMYYEQIQPINDPNSPYHLPGYEDYELIKARPAYIDSTSDGLYIQLSKNILSPANWMNRSDAYYNMLFRSIWKSMNWNDFRVQQHNIIPNISTLNDIRLEWQLVKTSQSGNRIEAKLYPKKVIMYYRNGSKIEWEYSKNFVDSNNIANEIHFILDPSVGNKYQTVELK